MNVIARLENELAYYDSAVHRFNHYTTRTPPLTFLTICLIFVHFWYGHQSIWLRKKTLQYFLTNKFAARISSAQNSLNRGGRHPCDWQYRDSWYSNTVSLQSDLKVALMAAIVKGDTKAPFSIATTLRCRGGRYSFPWIVPLYPWSLPYNTEF